MFAAWLDDRPDEAHRLVVDRITGKAGRLLIRRSILCGLIAAPVVPLGLLAARKGEWIAQGWCRWLPDARPVRFGPVA